jgi:hypothetical protein
MATGSLKQKDEFRNVSPGWCGAVTIDGRGDHHGTAVEPGGTVWLSEEEKIATANAPRADDDNPFLNGTFELVSRGKDVRNRRPYGLHEGGPVKPEPVEPAVEEETGATPPPATDPIEGEAAPGEEVATPDAVSKPARGRPRRVTTTGV